jgi:hypothetical protein
MSAHIFCQLVKYESQTRNFYTMSLVHANDMEEIDLVKGSHAIPDHLYSSSDIFGKKNQCPESKLGITQKEIKQTVAEDMGMMKVLRHFTQMIPLHDDGQAYQFIKLTRISRDRREILCNT